MIKPSKTNLRRAIQLGLKMARQQRRLRPHLQLAVTHPQYKEFVFEHRVLLQQSPLFLPWEEQIRQLILREGKAHGIPMDDAMCWEEYGTELVQVFYNAFWYGWEQILQLEQAHALVLRKLEEARAKAAAAATPESPEAEQERENFFETAADKLFAAMDGDQEEGTLWDLPAPDKPWAPPATSELSEPR
jgi:hypothetical protein